MSTPDLRDAPAPAGALPAFVPQCEYAGQVPWCTTRATLWARMHPGIEPMCDDCLCCRPCLEVNRAQFNRELNRPGRLSVECPDCGRRFTSYAEAVEEVPL